MNTSVSVHPVFRFDHDFGSNVEPHPRTSIRSQEPKHWPSGELHPLADETRGTWVTHFCLETLDRSWATLDNIAPKVAPCIIFKFEFVQLLFPWQLTVTYVSHFRVTSTAAVRLSLWQRHTLFFSSVSFAALRSVTCWMEVLISLKTKPVHYEPVGMLWLAVASCLVRTQSCRVSCQSWSSSWTLLQMLRSL